MMPSGKHKDIVCIYCGAVLGFVPAEGPGGRWYINRPAKPVGSDWACVNCQVNAKKEPGDSVQAKDGAEIAVGRG